MKLNIGKAIAHFREARGMTQTDLANVTGINQPTISQYERDKREPTEESLERITSALGITLGDIEQVALSVARGDFDNSIKVNRNHDTDFYITDDIVISVRTVIRNTATHKSYRNTIINEIIERALYRYMNNHYNEISDVILDELQRNKESIEVLLSELKDRR